MVAGCNFNGAASFAILIPSSYRQWGIMSAKILLFTFIVLCLVVSLFACECEETHKDPMLNCALWDSSTIRCSAARNLYDYEIAVWSFVSNNSIIRCCNSYKCTRTVNIFLPTVTIHTFLLVNLQRNAISLRNFKFCYENVYTFKESFPKDICAKSVGRNTSCFSNPSVPQASNAYSHDISCPCKDQHMVKSYGNNTSRQNASKGNTTPRTYPDVNYKNESSRQNASKGNITSLNMQVRDENNNSRKHSFKGNTTSRKEEVNDESNTSPRNAPEINTTPLSHTVGHTYNDNGTVTVTHTKHTVDNCSHNKDCNSASISLSSVGLAFFVFCLLEISKKLCRRGFQTCKSARIRRKSHNYNVTEGNDEPGILEPRNSLVDLSTKFCCENLSNKAHMFYQQSQHSDAENVNIEVLGERCKKSFPQASCPTTLKSIEKDTYEDHANLADREPGRRQMTLNQNISSCEVIERSANLRNSALSHVYCSIDDVQDCPKSSCDVRTIDGNVGQRHNIFLPSLHQNHPDHVDEGHAGKMNNHIEFLNTSRLKGGGEISHQNHHFRPCLMNEVNLFRHAYVNTPYSDQKLTTGKENYFDENSSRDLYDSHVYLNVPIVQLQSKKGHEEEQEIRGHREI